MNNDLFIYDTERFNSITSDDIRQQGLIYFTERRVLTLDKQDRVLTASVDDVATNIIYKVAVTQSTGDRLLIQCDCSPNQNRACKHAVAALYSYSAYAERYKKQIETAAHDVIQDCIDNGESEIRVKLISRNVGFGIWQATSIVPTPHGPESYQVHIRSLDKRLNYCTCPDLNRQRLGTCKHIESVLQYAHSKPDYSAFKEAGSPVSFVYMAWENNKPVIRLHPSANISDELVAICANFFAPNKVFMGHLPGDFFRYAEQVFDRDDIQLGEEALHYAQQCGKDEAQNVRAEQISQEILRTNAAMPGVTARLFSYQTEGVAFLASRGRAILADDIGLGKTLQAIVAASWLVNHGDVKKVLVVCSGSLKYQWAREIKKFSTHSVQIIQGNAEQRAVQYQSDALFFIVNYEVALRDLDLINDNLNPDLLIFDEPQRTKNWRTRASKLKSIPYRYVFVLSSLTFEKRLDDLYSVLQVIDEQVLDPFWRYLLDYQITDEAGNVIGYNNLAELQKRVAPFLLRRQRSEVNSQLPEKTEVWIDVPLDKKQRELHDIAMASAKQLAQVATRRTLTPGEQHRLMAALQQARMVCNAAGMIDKETQGSPKLHELSQLLEELCLRNNHKTVIFSQWALMTEMVELLTQQMGLGTVRLHSGINNEERTDLINRFKKDDSLKVLISTDAGGVDLSLKSATVLINLDMPWNPAILDQRIAHLHKSGQKNNIQVFSILAEDSYEQQVTKLVKSKRELFNHVISPETSDDVVGVSKKMLQTLIDALTGNSVSLDKHRNSEKNPSVQASALKSISPDAARMEAEIAPHLQQLIEKIKIAFRYRIRQVMGSENGVLVIVNPLNNSDADTAQQLSKDDIPVAVIDSQTLASLNCLPSFNTLTTIPVLYEVNVQTQTNLLTDLATAKLYSATLLLSQKSTAGVLDLLASAVLLQTAALAGQFQAPALDTVVVWLHNEILPQQLLTQEQANAIMRVVSLQQSQDVPFNLIEQAVSDAKLFF